MIGLEIPYHFQVQEQQSQHQFTFVRETVKQSPALSPSPDSGAILRQIEPLGPPASLRRGTIRLESGTPVPPTKVPALFRLRSTDSAAFSPCSVSRQRVALRYRKRRPDQNICWRPTASSEEAQKAARAISCRYSEPFITSRLITGLPTLSRMQTEHLLRDSSTSRSVK